MGRKTRWTTRIFILMVISGVFYVGWHVYACISNGIEEAKLNKQKEALYYGEYPEMEKQSSRRY